MIRIQAVHGRFTALDTVCKRCRGEGKDPTATQTACVFCGGSGVVVEHLGRPYTYLAPDGTKLWDVMQVDVGGQTKLATVVSLTSGYEGPTKEAYPLPPTTMDCEGCGAAGVPIRAPWCDACAVRMPQDLRMAYLNAEGPFRRVTAARPIRSWLKENPPAVPMVDGGRPAGYGREDAPEWTS